MAMAEAVVGDDVMGEDPTVAELEARVAKWLGKEAALFCPTGTMANQIAIHCQTRPGDEIVAAENSHIAFYEQGAPAVLSTVNVKPIDAPTGIFTAEAVAAKLRRPNIHFARTALVCIENTTNLGGGRIWPVDAVAKLSSFVHERGICLHLDGARIWNASVATGIPEIEWARHCDSVSVCFSKGLGAPVGSAVAGTASFVAEARRARKLFGGAMRQAGIIAAGSLFALDHNRERLAVDHANARIFAENLARVKGVTVDPVVETNIVYWSVSRLNKDETFAFAKTLSELPRPVKCNAVEDGRIRAVTCYEVDEAQVRDAVSIIAGQVAKL